MQIPIFSELCGVFLQSYVYTLAISSGRRSSSHLYVYLIYAFWVFAVTVRSSLNLVSIRELAWGLPFRFSLKSGQVHLYVRHRVAATIEHPFVVLKTVN